MLRFDKTTYLSLVFKLILSERLSNSLQGSDVLLFPEFINIVSILFYNFIKFIISIYTFLVITFARYKKYIICLISISEFSDLLHVFTCTSAIGNTWIFCLGVNIFNFSPYFALYLSFRNQKRMKCKKSMNYTYLIFWFWFWISFFFYFVYSDLKYFNFLILLLGLHYHLLNKCIKFW